MPQAHERPRLALPLGLCSPLALASRLEARPGLVVLDGDGSRPRGLRSFVASDPVEIVAVEGGHEPLDALARIDADVASSGTRDVLPRWIGFVGYDAARAAIDEPRHVPPAGPSLWFGRYEAIAVFDATTGRAEIVGDDEDAIARMRARIDGGCDDEDASGFRVGELDVDDADGHAHAIERALEAIVRGDVYQVNLARRARARFSGSTLGLYRAMAEASPVPYGGYLRAGGTTLLGRSMECFLAFDAVTRRLVTRPIKGTIPESTDRAGDAQRLREDPKERAEHVMVVDLLRNDLGRVAVVGTVRVDEALVVEPFARLSHLVSTIACELPGRAAFASVVRATFPPGSVTGTPKRAAMRLIEALERHARGPYCGAYGYVSGDGSFELAVTIRTAVVSDGRLDYHAGGGIVFGSDPRREVAETELKTRVLRDALASRDHGQT